MGSLIALLPMLAGLFSGSGSGGTGGPLDKLFSDPTLQTLFKQSMFGNDARTLPYIDPNTGQVTFEGPNAPGLIGLQYADALRNDPLKAAITRMAGGLLPTNAGFNNGAFPFANHLGQGNRGNGSSDQNGGSDGNGRGNTPITHQFTVPGDATGSVGNPLGTTPRNRQLSLSPATPDYPQLLAQLRTIGASLPALPPLQGGTPLAPPMAG
jgi:hypothetical protein